MRERDEAGGEFDAEQVDAPPKRPSPAVTVIRFFLAGITLMIAFVGTLYVATRGAEREPPIVSLSEKFNSLTAKPIKLEVVAQDLHSGLQAVNIWIRQGEKATELVSKQLARERTFKSELTLDAAKLGLDNGPGELIVQAWDDSIWNTSTDFVQPFVIDTRPPHLELVHAPTQALEGSVAVVLYRAADANLTRSGVELSDGTFLQGVPAAVVDPDFTDPDLYVCLFSARPSVSYKAAAYDVSGSTSLKPLHLSVQGRSSGESHRFVAPTGALSHIIRAEFEARLASLEGEAKKNGEKLLEAGQHGDRQAIVAMARALVNDMRGAHLKKIQEVLRAAPPEPRRWRHRDALSVQRIKVNFNDRLTIADPSGDIVSWSSLGEQWDSPLSGAFVTPAFGGTVRSTQHLSGFGTSVLIDHGAGLSSLYFSLSGIFVDWGAKVEPGQRIGQVGSSGLAFSDRARYIFLLHGEPVDPREFLDVNRLSAAIEGPLSGAKRRLRIPNSMKGAAR